MEYGFSHYQSRFICSFLYFSYILLFFFFFFGGGGGGGGVFFLPFFLTYLL